METPTEYTIEKRVSVSIALGNYLRAMERFNQANAEFEQSCKELRNQLGESERFVAVVSYRHYLVHTDDSGNFDVEPIQSL